jgi:hypothetical protein
MSERTPQPDVPVVPVAPILPWQQPAARVVRPAGPPVVKIAPLAPWDEPALPTYHAVEVPAPPEALPSYPLVELAEDPAEKARRLREEERLLARIRLPRRRRQPQPLQREKHWYQCLRYPLRIWKTLLIFAGLLAFASMWLTLSLPLAWTTVLQNPLVTAWFCVPLLLLAYGCALLQCVLNIALAGEPPRIYWPGLRHMHIALADAGRWLFCFLAGPVLLAGGAVYYWIHCGDVDGLDFLILAELGALALGYWLFALVAATRAGLRAANPWRVAELVQSLGYRAAIAVLLLFLVALYHGRLAVGALAELHRFGGGGFFQLCFCWFSALVCLAFVFRLVGLWCYQREKLAESMP